MAGTVTNRRGNGGFTMLEVTIAAGLMAFVGLALIGLMRAGRGGADVTRRMTMANSDLRTVSRHIHDSLSMSQHGRVTVNELGDKNHSVTFQRALDCKDGAVTWGAYDVMAADGERERPGCYHCYTVVKTEEGRDLVHRILDDGGKVQTEETLVRGLASGSEANPGLRVIKSGVLWRVTVSLAGSTGKDGQTLTFDVALRN